MSRRAGRARRSCRSITRARARGELQRPLAVVNIGGVANVTYDRRATTNCSPSTPAPAMRPIDDWALKHTGEAVDRDGALARGGRRE